MSSLETYQVPPPPRPPDERSGGFLFKTIFGVAVTATMGVSFVAAIVFWHFSHGLPKIITVADYRPLGVTRIVAIGPGPQPSGAPPVDQTVIGEFFKERRYLVPIEKIPQVAIQAFVSAEDDRFFDHPGINIVSMIRAGIANFRAGHVVQGGSTITQQVAKSLLLTPERSFSRKIKEVILASRIEKNLTKQQILYLYLNQIYLGHGAYGIQSAAQTYFRKDVSELSLAEAAVLAGMPQAPGKYSPLVNPKKAKERQLYVLRRMFENKYISQAQMLDAAAQPLKVYHDEDINLKYSAYLVEHIRKYLVEKYGEKAVYEDGLTVYVPTTPALARVATTSLRDGLRAVDKRIGYRGPLQHLSKSDEIADFLRDLRSRLIERKLHFQMFLPDGRIDAVEAMRYGGIQSDMELLDPGDIYQAVVTSLDDKKKAAGVMIGAVRATLPLENMKWARAVRDEKNPQAWRPEPSAPSKVLQKGDVVLVKVDSVSNRAVVVSLDQEPQVQGGLFSIEAQTGNVLAMEGGYDFEQSEFNRADQALRQPGSAFKPIVYASALEKGYTPASIIVDSPIVYDDSSGKWKPNNFEEKFYGDTTFRQALIKSRNVVTIKIVQNINIPYVINYARRIGMTSQFPMDLSISLGSATVSLEELTKIYALFPRMGRRVTPIFLTRVEDRDGKLLEENKPQQLPAMIKAPPPITFADPPPGKTLPEIRNGKANIVMPEYPPADDPDQVLDPRVAYVMTNLMKEVVAYGTGHAASGLGRPAAGKTGTTSDCIDAWFMGFTPYVVTGVWVGFDNQTSIGPNETGARAALPTWLNFMREAVKGYPDADFTIPPGIVFASIDPQSGRLAAPNSSDSIKEAFIEGTEPTAAGARRAAEAPATPTEFFKEDTQ